MKALVPICRCLNNTFINVVLIVVAIVFKKAPALHKHALEQVQHWISAASTIQKYYKNCGQFSSKYSSTSYSFACPFLLITSIKIYSSWISYAQWHWHKYKLYDKMILTANFDSESKHFNIQEKFLTFLHHPQLKNKLK